MKKLYLLAAMALFALVGNAQKKVAINTFSGTDITKYAGAECDVTMNRLVFNGWNTIALPFAVSEAELNEALGSDCRLERLVGVDSNGKELVLNFQDCKSTGIEPNIPYILYYSGETGMKKLAKVAYLEDGVASLTFKANNNSAVVTMSGTKKRIEADGLYGVLAKDNSEAKFVSVDDVTGGFAATRCFVTVSTGNQAILKTNHLAEGEVTAIESVVKKGENADIYNLSGIKVANKVSGLQPGIYIVNGKKVRVK
jgi:hypothetical protein